MDVRASHGIQTGDEIRASIYEEQSECSGDEQQGSDESDDRDESDGSSCGNLGVQTADSVEQRRVTLGNNDSHIGTRPTGNNPTRNITSNAPHARGDHQKGHADEAPQAHKTVLNVPPAMPTTEKDKFVFDLSGDD